MSKTKKAARKRKKVRLALIGAGGMASCIHYLTQTGAAVVMCPSMTAPEGVSSLMTDDDGTAHFSRSEAEELAQYSREALTYDPTEPFFTTGGKVAWANGNMIQEHAAGFMLRDRDCHYLSNVSVDNAMGRPPSKRNIEAGDLPSGWNLSHTCSSHQVQIPWVVVVREWGDSRCKLWATYELRGASGSDRIHLSHRLRDIAGRALVSDATYQGFWAYGGTYSRTSWRLLLDHPTTINASYFWSNHDSAYNVLFTDGSVKTFSDAGKSIYKFFAQEKAELGGWNATMDTTYRIVWEGCFDPLYAQD